jgi:hypothetical protein
MAYLLENDTSNITNDILTRKEFYQYDLPEHEQQDDINKSIIPRFMISKMISDGNFLQLHSYQLFTSNYINPNTPYSRLQMKWQTGIGKTIGALSIAMNFINYYKKEEAYGDSSIGSVFIIGFTARIFKNELLRFPEFGIITRTELEKLNNLRKLSYGGTKFDSDRLQEFMMKINKKFNNRVNNGFFQFIGYKQLVNMVFKITDPTVNISDLDETGIHDAIDSGKIKLNTELLDEFKNSLVICDEIHNVYNSLYKNNWGVTLQYVLNYHSSIRSVFMSATPINNNPTEIIDLLNLLLPIKYYKKLEKKDFFDNDKQLIKGALSKISNLCKGRISFIRDSNPKYYPTKKFIGETIHNAPYLKFIRCPMSPFHYNTYKEVYTGALSPESQYLTDFALPNPDNKKIGLYQTSKIKRIISFASQKWKDDNKINYKQGKIVGDILRLENLGSIASKFHKMMEVVNEIIKNRSGKLFIYHNIIHMSGVLFIQEIMKQNYIIGEHDGSTQNTLCIVCGKMRKYHNQEQISGGSNDIQNTKAKKIMDVLLNIDIVSCGRYNELLDSYEIKSDTNNIFSYKILDEIVIIQDFYITNENIDDNYCSIIHILKTLSNHAKIIIRATKINKNLESGLKDIFTMFNCSGFIYYTNITLENDKTDLCKYINTFLNISGGKKNKKNKIGKDVTTNTKSDNIDPKHSFIPVRFISMHGELDKTSMHNSLNKFNSPDNSNGYRIMILIGGKLMQESYDIKAVRELMIMGRPANIPTLIQIIGRAVRKNSHRFLPENKRNVNIRIFTSCLPMKVKMGGKLVYGLGYEEDKYIEKLKHYKIIQNIEKTLHENAIDAYINQDIIWSKEERYQYKYKKKEPQLGALYYEPNVTGKLKQYPKYRFKINELNLQTFDTYHSHKEVSDVIFIIKRLFIEKSPVWNYKDLLLMVKNAQKYFQVEFNSALINETSFIIALSFLNWVKDISYIDPIINKPDERTKINAMNNIIEKIFDSNDKIIKLPSGQNSVITQVGEYYMLFPLDSVNNEPIKVIELPYRILKTKKHASIDIKMFMESGNTLINYSDKRDRFYTKWNNVEIEKLELAVCDFGTDFHTSFLEECIQYIFNVWLDPKIKKSSMHTFYFKMLNYYDLRKLVVWGHTLKPYLFKKYKPYLIPVSIKLQQKKTINLKEKQEKNINNKESINKDKSENSDGILNLLKSSINKSDLNWVSSGLKSQFNENLDMSLKLFDGNYKKINKKKDKRVNADYIPVGHLISYIPRFYTPEDNWFETPEYLNPTHEFIENTTIVGYDEKTKTGVHIRFKIRSPIQNIKQYKDSRLIEKGSVCSSKSKFYLRDIAQKIGISIKGKINVAKLCNDIRTKLIYLELKERESKTKKKWFYFIYEKRPETILDE